jgi:hypoxanthine phosphoribosyltransferase
MQPYQEFLAKVLIDEETLQKRIGELAAEIDRDYAGEDLLLICILRGGVFFMIDLMRRLNKLISMAHVSNKYFGEGLNVSAS